MTWSLNTSPVTSPQLLHLYMSRRCKKINVHRKLKGRASQVCPQVRGALWDIDKSLLLQKPCWDNTSTQILLTEVVQTVHLGKVGRYFIIHWDEICLQSRYRKTNWKGHMSCTGRHSCPRDFSNLTLHLSPTLFVSQHVFWRCLLCFPKFNLEPRCPLAAHSYLEECVSSYFLLWRPALLSGQL